MHRSGTSALTGMLQQAGVRLGRVSTFSPFNLKGNREHPPIVHLHERLLAFNGGSWSAPPARVVWTGMHRRDRNRIIEAFSDIPLWGFKDPRTLFTLDGWLEALPDALLVGIFRHPRAVALSLQRRNGFSPQFSYALWEAYNERLLERHRNTHFPLISFDLEEDALVKEMRNALAQLNLCADDTGGDFLEARLRTMQDDGSPMPSTVERVYLELCARQVQ